MVLTIIQAQILINQFNNINLNQPVHMAAPSVNFLLRPFEGNKHPGYPKGLKNYLQTTKDIDKKDIKLYLSVSNDKNIIYNFLSIANK